MESEKTKKFVFIGGDLSLNFTNTVGNFDSEKPSEHIHSFADLAAWSEQSGLVSDGESKRLLNEAEQNPKKAKAVLARAVALSESLHRIFSDVASDKKPKNKDLDILNEELSEAMRQARIFIEEDDFVWDWTEAQLDVMLRRVARTAAELLTSDKIKRIRRCADDVCGWLFLDTSKNRSRRWCAMGDCGNLHKSRRFRAKEILN